MGSFLRLDGLAKSFGNTLVLDDFSVDLGEGEVLALLGLSGSGKTTALRLLAGFETPDRGRIFLGDEEVTPLPPEKRGFGMVFQHYALFPHMTVAQNVAFGLESRGRPKDQIASRVREMLALVRLESFGERRVSAISGGQQQRVALARALAPEPRLLLLDEPLSNLDPALREQTREELRAAVRRIGITTVLVTHEQEEAFHVGDSIAVLHEGRLQQVASAVDLYMRPRTPFVASFIGRSTALRGVVESTDSGSDGGQDVEVSVRLKHPNGSTLWTAACHGPIPVGEPVDLVVRPESLSLEDPSRGGSTLDEPGLPGRIKELRFTGAATYALVDVDRTTPLQVRVADAASGLRAGDSVVVRPHDHGPRPRAFSPSEPA